jgi:hypothetical protein
MLFIIPRGLRLIGLSVLMVVPLSLAFSAAQPYTVCPSGCPFTKIQAALDAANEGDTITVGPGVYRENLKITKSLSLSGADPAQVRLLPGGPAYALVQIGEESTLKTVRIEGFTLQRVEGLVEYAVSDDVVTSIERLIFRNNDRVVIDAKHLWDFKLNFARLGDVLPMMPEPGEPFSHDQLLLF